MESKCVGQCQSWLLQGLHPRAMTRDLEWGVKVPVCRMRKEKFCMCGLMRDGYITASKEWFEQPETRNTLSYGGNQNQIMGNVLKSDDTKLVHFIGKDNIVFTA